MVLGFLPLGAIALGIAQGAVDACLDLAQAERPAGSKLREQPTPILIHGAPGFGDHSAYKPAFSQLADVTQLIYLDLRGAGRSDRSTPEHWTVEQWANDLYEF